MQTFAKDYLDPDWTITAAAQAGLSVGDFVEAWLAGDGSVYSLGPGLGHTSRCIDRLLAATDLPQGARTLEIGPGTGRYYAELRAKRPDIRCEVYETDDGWAAWLEETYGDSGLIRRNVDGKSLGATPSGSIDLCSAHGVFVYLDPLVSFNYLKEASRCLRDGGYLYFDLLDMDRRDIVDVIHRSLEHCSYLVPISATVVQRFLNGEGLQLLDRFHLSSQEDISTYFLYGKTRD
jgi:SAM-dependent methyltransferase